jgi:hypothetical protein
MTEKINLLDVVTLTVALPEFDLRRGEIGAVVECYPDDSYEVEFVAQDGYTYALVTLSGNQLIPLREKPIHTAPEAVPALA